MFLADVNLRQKVPILLASLLVALWVDMDADCMRNVFLHIKIKMRVSFNYTHGMHVCSRLHN